MYTGRYFSYVSWFISWLYPDVDGKKLVIWPCVKSLSSVDHFEDLASKSRVTIEQLGFKLLISKRHK